ncbi:MAG: nucleotidyltransferase domain-containing protein [Thermodesulfobacteriota bacterium]|nr:nucleotidyltransferase domain-containing protein [Thermodesulfobacteriota bacterium]MDY6793300.1 nucleotidyltransferase domain-containing protein [Thermodesulfobacteriota bacterium]
MRANKQQTDFIKQSINQYLPNAKVYLFGSRVHDDQKGGDIDILVIGEKEPTGVLDYALIVGNPARKIGWACECGERPLILKHNHVRNCENVKKV